MLYRDFNGSMMDDLLMQERRTTAKVCNMLYNLPEILLKLDSEFAAQTAAKARFIASQESGSVDRPHKTMQEIQRNLEARGEAKR